MLNDSRPRESDKIKRKRTSHACWLASKSQRDSGRHADDRRTMAGAMWQWWLNIPRSLYYYCVCVCVCCVLE